MSQLGVRCAYYGKVSHSYCTECSLKPLHPCGFPANLLEKMRASEDYERTEFTPSTLLECDRRTVLYTTRDHWMDPEHEWWLHRGHDIHHYLEMLDFPEGSVVATVREKRLKTTVETKYGTQLISGKMDLVVVKRVEDEIISPKYVNLDEDVYERVAYCKIVDYKTKKVEHSLVKPDRKHQMQLNIYAWLVENTLLDLDTPQLKGVDRVVVDELELVYIDMGKCRRFSSEGEMVVNGVKRKGAREAEKITLAQINLLDMQTVEAWVVSRIEQKIQAKTTLPSVEDALYQSGNDASFCFFCPMKEVCATHE